MNLASTDLRQQLKAPDRTGRDLALLRTRLYRFSSDLRWYVIAESLEENYLAGGHPKPATMTAVRSCLDKIRHDGSPMAFRDNLAEAEDIDIGAGLEERAPYMWQRVATAAPPRKVVVIVGAPRSGTSHLFNLLAATGRFAYFTTASCWAWPVRNLYQPGGRLFTVLTDTVLTVDNKRTRIIPGLVMPGEAEDIWHRAMPVYRHLRGHCYDISPQQESGDPRILHAAAHAHLAHFNRDVLLVKSPFSSFRISADRTELGHGSQVHPHSPRTARDSRVHAPQPVRVHHRGPTARWRKRMVAFRQCRPRQRACGPHLRSPSRRTTARCSAPNTSLAHELVTRR